MADHSPDSGATFFDEQTYLALNPDVAAAVAGGRELSGWHHYDRVGRDEGRRCGQFDADFYLAAYPLAAREVAEGKAPDALAHYQTFGRARGYIAARDAIRPDDAGMMARRFGGLWTDAPDARDRVRGRLETGMVTEAEADALERWIEDGYVVLSGAVAHNLIDAAAADLDRAYAGGYPNLLFECGAISIDGMAAWRPEMNPVAAKALDIHHFSGAIRDVIFSPIVRRFLEILFEQKPLASQTLGFLRGSAQAGHQDSAYVAYTIPRRFAASWIALEDVTLGAGELFYYPGSHRFPDFLYADRYKSVAEAQRMTGDPSITAQIDAHVAGLEQRANRLGMTKHGFAARKGDALIWSADLVHGGNPVSSQVTRKSVVTHYCPKTLAPLFAEPGATRLHEHPGGFFTTSFYCDLSPDD